MADRRRLVRKPESVPLATANEINVVTNPTFGGGVLTPWAQNHVTGSASVVGGKGRQVCPGTNMGEGLYCDSPAGPNTYVPSVELTAISGTAQVHITAAAIDAGFGVLASVSTAAFTPAGAPTRYQAPTLVAPTGTTNLRIIVSTATAAARTVDIDNVSSGSTYSDGDTAGWGWFGVPYASASGSLTATLRDLENGSTYQSVRDSWTVTPGQRKTTMAQSQRRYGGAIPTGESHDNGTISWQCLVYGASADACIANADALIGDLESLRVLYDDMFVEWRPDGATASTYYEVRGPATWQPGYKWSQFSGAGSMVIEIKIPVAPLAQLDSYSIAIPSTTIPASIALGAAVTGRAPALASISLTTSGGAAAPIWALLGWTKRPGTPLASSSVPFGIFNAYATMTPTTWAVTVDANYRGGSGLKTTTAGAGTASATLLIDPSTMLADEFTPGEISVEVWARVELASTVVSPRVVLSLLPFAGAAFGGEQFSAEFGSTGRLLTLPSSGTRFRFVKIGTLSMPVDASQPLTHLVKVAASWAVGSSGQYGLDNLVLVPARQRALSPSGKPNDAGYPDFIGSTGATTKTIRSDLSGRVASGSGYPGRDSGLGGSMIEMPVGDVDLLVKLSSLVADDPTVDATTEQISHTGVTGSVRVTPRVWLAG